MSDRDGGASRDNGSLPLHPALAQALAMVAAIAAEARDDWWIIGSTAVALHGRFADCPKDVDLLMSADDAAAFLQRSGQFPRAGKGDDLFRSAIFGIWSGPPVPVEVMGDLSVATPQGWECVRPLTRQSVTVAGAELFVPSREELVRLLLTFGRDKDLERAKLLT